MDGDDSDYSDSDVEIVKNEETASFFEQLDDSFVPTTWDFSQAMQSATVASQCSTKSLVADMIRKKAATVRNAEVDHSEQAGADDNSDSESGSDHGERDAEGDAVGTAATAAAATAEEEAEDVVKKRKKEKFFEQPPPQVTSTSFIEMNLSRPLLKAVGSLGYKHPSPIQAATIPIALAGKDICACAATGTGKTAAFMLPIVERLLFRPAEPLTRVLVVLPTRELAVQVHAVATSLAKHTSVTVCLATGGMDSRQQEAALRKLPDIVIATPGRLVDHLHNTPSFNLGSVEILVLDEADRMLEEHFEEQLREILRLCYRGRQTMLFSATMTDEVEELVSLSLNQPVRLFLNSNTQVASNLQQEFVRIRGHREDSRPAIIAAMCSRSFSKHVIIFVPTKVLAHRLRIQLGLLDLKVEELHGNLTQLQRLEALESFKKGEVDYLIATDLASRGLDIAGVRTVINYSMPSSIKQYVHRVGRTARAGKSGRSVSLVGEKERHMLKQVIKQSGSAVKVRAVPQDVVKRYSERLSGVEKLVQEILKEEAVHKETQQADMEVRKAENLMKHEEEIYSRPKRVWLPSKPASGTSGQTAASKQKTRPDIVSPKVGKAKKKGNKAEKEDPEVGFIRRQAKRANRPKRHRVMED